MLILLLTCNSNKPFFFFFFRWRYSSLWDLACRTILLHFSLSITNSLHLLTPSTWRSFYTSSLHSFLGLPLHLVLSSSWVKIFLGILSSSILSRWPSQLILCPFSNNQLCTHILFDLKITLSPFIDVSSFLWTFCTEGNQTHPYVLFRTKYHWQHNIFSDDSVHKNGRLWDGSWWLDIPEKLRVCDHAVLQFSGYRSSPHISPLTLILC